MKPVNKFVICVVIAIVAITCGYLIYYTWSISFGEIDSGNLEGYDETSYRSNERTTKFNGDELEVDFEAHKNFHLFNSEDCGKFENVIKDRVVNGEPAKFLANPWMVTLSYKLKNGDVVMKCAGTLISERLILTAAHCLATGKQVLTTIHLGDYDLSTEPDCEINSNGSKVCADHVQEISKEDFTFEIHPKFSKYVKAYDDIGLIKLKVPAKLHQNNIGTICLPFSDNKIPGALEVIGWGRTENAHKSDILIRASLPLVKNDECFIKMKVENAKRSHDTLELIHTQFCAGGKDNKDSCTGDSGGPIQTVSFQHQIKTARTFQYGIVSYGMPECGIAPGVYTKIPSYLKWILDNATL